MRLILAGGIAALLIAGGAWHGAAAGSLNCRTLGNQTSCSDGSSVTRLGNFSSDEKGNYWQRTGTFTFGSDGTTYDRIGQMTHDNKGNIWNRVGNYTYGSDGSACTTIGDQVQCTGGSRGKDGGNTARLVKPGLVEAE